MYVVSSKVYLGLKRKTNIKSLHSFLHELQILFRNVAFHNAEFFTIIHLSNYLTHLNGTRQKLNATNCRKVIE